MSTSESAAWHDWQTAWSIRKAEAGRPPEMLALPGDQTADTEHAAGAEGTLCGIPETEIARYRHLFNSGRSYACATCRAVATRAD